MKKLLIVGGLSSYDQNAEASGEIHDFIKEVAGDQFEVLSTHLDLITYTIAPGVFEAHDSRNNLDLHTVDMVFIRGPKISITSSQASYLCRFCAWNGVKFLNDYSIYYSGTKVAQTIVFLEEGLPFLRTAYAANKALLIAYAEQKFGYPYVLKSSTASHGDSNYLVYSAEQAQQIISGETGVDFLAQEFCPNDRDYRLLLLRDLSLTFERRGTAGSHLNNTSKGGEAKLAAGTVPDYIFRQAHKVADRLGLTIAGVDVMPHLHTGEYYFLEINSQPQLRTGALLEEKKTALRRLFETGA